MRCSGQVVHVIGRRATVAVRRRYDCERCARGQGCGFFRLGQASDTINLECHTEDRVSPGQQVVVELARPPRDWLALVFTAYGLPTLGLLMAPLLVSIVSPDIDDSLLGVAALLGLFGGVFAWRILSKRLSNRIEMGLWTGSDRIVATTYPNSEEVNDG